MRRGLLGKLVLAGALMGALPAGAAVHRVLVRPWGWGWGWGYWHDPFYYGYAPYPPAWYHGDQGEVKLETHVKDAEVFVDGAYAGTAGKLKSMWLSPGGHDLEVRAPNGERFQQRIYVMTGKTIHVRPVLG